MPRDELDALSKRQLEAMDRQEKFKKDKQKDSEGSTKKRKSKKDGGSSSKKKKKSDKSESTPTNGMGADAKFFGISAVDEEDDTASIAEDGVKEEASTERASEKRAKSVLLLGLITHDIIDFLKQDPTKKYTFQTILESVNYNDGTGSSEDRDENSTEPVSYENSLAVKLDLKTQTKLFKELKDNLKVDYEPGPTKVSGKSIDTAAQFCFKAVHQIVKKKEDILTLLRSPDYIISGVPSSELRESYKTVDEDITELTKEKLIRVIPNQEKKCDILYYNDPVLDMIIDPKLKDLWRNPKVKNQMPPRIDDIGRFLQKFGEKETETIVWPEDEHKRNQQAKSEEMARNNKQRKQRKMNADKMTNKHLKEDIEQQQQQLKK